MTGADEHLGNDDKPSELTDIEVTRKTPSSPGQPIALADHLQKVTGLVDDRYSEVAFLGSGGMGHVFRAKHKLLGHLVAIKVLNSGDVADPTQLKRLQSEAKAIKQLTHPNIVSMREFDIAQETAYLVMDYVDGKPLSALIAAGARMSESEFLDTFDQACQALSHAHSRGVIHRDIKPSNIMIADGGDGRERVKLVDFGIAKIEERGGAPELRVTQTGELLGTPLYMSPEQSMGRSLDKRSDLYALGCIMYECIAGRPPIMGENLLDTVHKRLHQEPPTFKQLGITCSPGIEAIIRKCLVIDPEQRFQSADELRSALSDPDKFAVAARPTTQSKASLYWMCGAIVACLALVLMVTVKWYNAPVAPNVSARQTAPKETFDSVLSKMVAAGSLMEKNQGKLAQPILEPLVRNRQETTQALGKNGATEYANIVRMYGRSFFGDDDQYEKSRSLLNQALQLQAEADPRSKETAHTHKDLGDLLMRDRYLGSQDKKEIPADVSGAVREYQTALNILQNDDRQGKLESEIRTALAFALERLEKYDQAETQLKSAAKLDLKNHPLHPSEAADAFDSLGHFYDARGQKKKAEQAFKYAAALRRTRMWGTPPPNPF